MSSLRRGGAVLLSTLVLCAVSALPARAQTQTVTTVTVPEAFLAEALAQALDLRALGIDVTLGATRALIDSSAKADAQGAGVLLVAGTVAKALVSGATGVDDPPAACVLSLPLGVLNVAGACGDAKALISAAGPSATAEGGVAAVDLNLNLLDDLLDDLLLLAGNTINAVVTPLIDLLGGLLNPLLDSLNLQPTDLVDDLIAGLRRATGVLRIQLGNSTAQTLTGPDSVTSTAIANGGRIDVLPGLTLTGEPLLSIIIGSAQASVAVSRPAPATSVTRATAVPTFDPAIVTVRLGLPLLGNNITEIPVRLGSPLRLLEGTPLASTITLGAGSATTGPDGVATAVADGVSLSLLEGLGGGIQLRLAHARAVAGGASAQIVTRQINPPQIQPPPQLARTGGTPVLPLTGFGLILVALAVRRAVAVRH